MSGMEKVEQVLAIHKDEILDSFEIFCNIESTFLQRNLVSSSEEFRNKPIPWTIQHLKILENEAKEYKKQIEKSKRGINKVK